MIADDLATQWRTLDQAIMRVCDAMLAFPTLILAMAMSVIRGQPGVGNVVIAIILVLWPQYARLLRGEIYAARSREHVMAAQAAGATTVWVLRKHIVPAASGPVVVKGTLDIGFATLVVSSLSFLGFGAVPPAPDWGAMVSQRPRIGLQFWWCSAFAGLAIMSIVMALDVLGDALRDRLDPRIRRRRR